MQRIFVLSQDRKPLMPCLPARARKLLNKGKAKVYRYYPFCIILQDRTNGDTQAISCKLDPGSKTTGVALVGIFPMSDYTSTIPIGLAIGGLTGSIIGDRYQNPLLGTLIGSGVGGGIGALGTYLEKNY